MKKLLILGICLVLGISSLSACAKNKKNEGTSESMSNETNSGDITFWSASTAETILLKKDISHYENVRRNAEIDIEMAKNEYEGAQLFLTANEDVGEYYIDTFDLKSDTGKTFSKDYIDVYAYKYLDLTFTNASRGIGIGTYPDAILPIEASVRFEENNIAKGHNQGIYFRFHTMQDTEPGTYLGKVTVRYDGKSKDIPVSVKVWDVEVSETNHKQTLFSNKWNWANPELDSTDERFQSYIDLMTEYRIGSINLMNINDRDRGNIDAVSKTYAQKVYEYVINPVNAAYCIEYFTTGDSFDKVAYQKFIVAIAEKSFETNFNCLTKATTYFGSLIDEATMQGKFSETVLVTNDYRSVLQSTYAELLENKERYLSEYDITEEFFDEIATTAKTIPHIFVANYRDEYAPYINEDGTGTGTWCPNVWEFQDEKNVRKYEEINLNWWYCCGGSSRAIPSYQLDDYTLSPRIMSWQEIYYGITGSLYWATNLNYAWNGSNYSEKEDYYTVVSAIAGGIGDGQLTYPGGQYELSTPVATRRLEAIRDGLEEYELLRDLKNRYAEIASSNGQDFTFDEIYGFLTENLFDGINIISSAESFETSRNLMFQLLSLANSDAGLCVTDLNITTTEINGKCFVKDGYSLKLNGNSVSGTATNGGKMYSFKLDLNNYTNSCELSVPELSGNNSFKILSKGKAVYSDAEGTYSNFKSGYITIEKSLVEAGASGISGSLSSKLVKVKVDALTDDGLQGFRYTDENVKKLGKATSSMLIRVYNASGKEQRLSIEAKYTSDPIIRQVAYIVLQEGWNEIEIKGIDQKDWTSLGSIDHLLFIFEEDDHGQCPEIDSLYFDGYYITYLEEVK